MSRSIPIGHGLFAIVDDDDYPKLSAVKWHARHSRGPHSHRTYAVRNAPRGTSPSAIRMHRLVIGANPGEFVDHINGNGLDNRKQNLRICSNQENLWNRRKSTYARSSFKGVRFVEWTANKGKRFKRRSPWKAEITVSGKSICLGYHKTEKEAAHAYDVGANKYFGEFARPNFAETNGEGLR